MENHHIVTEQEDAGVSTPLSVPPAPANSPRSPTGSPTTPSKRKTVTFAPPVSNCLQNNVANFESPISNSPTEKTNIDDLASNSTYTPFILEFMCGPYIQALIGFFLLASVIAFMTATCGVGGVTIAAGLMIAGYTSAAVGGTMLTGHLVCVSGFFKPSMQETLTNPTAGLNL